MAIRLALEEKGYQVTMAPNHDSAMEVIQVNHFDLVITGRKDRHYFLSRTKRTTGSTRG